jgi:hypothetical protein
MARARWSKSDIPGAVGLGVIFVAAGVIYGLLRGDGIVIGALAGTLLFVLVIVVGTIAEVAQRKK